MNQRGFAPVVIVVLVLIVLAAIGGAYYFGTQKNTIPSNTNQTITSKPVASADPTAGWKSYSSAEGGYEFKYPSDWIVQTQKEKFPYDTTYDKAAILFESRARTDDAPGLPVDMGTGSIKVVTIQSLHGDKSATLSEKEFTDPNNNFWVKGDIGGGGGGTTYLMPEKTTIAGKVAMKQSFHSTIGYEGIEPSQITTNYYVWLNNSAKEMALISFTYDDKNSNKESLIGNFNKMLATFKITSSVEPSPSNAKVLNYKVPLGWQTVQNSTGEFQVSFNPAKYDRASAEPDELINIYGKTTTPGYTPTLYSIKIYPYDGGSRHAFIDKVMNGSSYRWEKTYEKEYLVNGKSALAVYNADASQTTLLAMMVIDSKRAFFIGGNSNENAVEELLSSLKVLK